MLCVLCNKKLPARLRYYREIIGIVKCPHCGAIQGRCYKGDSYVVVKGQFSPVEIPAELWTYFDIETVGSTGLERRHGWFDEKTGLLLQVG